MREIQDTIKNNLTNVKEQNGKIFADCPYCGKPAARQKFSFSPEKGDRSKTGIFGCFSCGAKGTGWQLAKHLCLIPLEKYAPPKLQSYTPKTIHAENKTFNVIQNFSSFSRSIEIIDGRACVPEKIIYETRDPETRDILFFKTVEKEGEKKKVFSGHYLNGQPVFGLPENTIKHPYNLHKAKNADYVFIVEGEKCAAVLSAFLPAVQCAIGTHGHGGMKNLPLESIEHLLNKQIFIIPDLDKVGKQAAATLCRRLQSYGIETKIIELPGADKNGYDIDDFLKSKSIADFFRLIDETGRSHSDNFIKKNLPAYNKTEKFNSKYVTDTLTPELIAARTEKVIKIQAAQGTGKTEFFAKMADYAREHGRDIIALTHRIALGSQIAQRLRIFFYKNDEAEILGKRGKFKLGSLVCSADSMMRIALPKIYYLFVDEIDQFLDHLLRSGTMKGKRRIDAMAAFKALILNAEKIIISSADIPTHVLEFFEELGLDIVCFKNEYKAANKTFTIHEKGNELLNEIEKELKDEKKIWAGFSGKGKLKKTARLLKKKYPDKKILLIHSGNSQTDEIQETIETPQLLQKYDVVFYSPSIFTGADFNNLPEFSKGFLYIDGTDTPATEILQAASRFRQTNDISAYVKNNNGHRDTDPEKIKENLLNFKSNPEGEYTTVNSLNERDIENSIFLDLYVKIESERNHSINFLRLNFYNLLKQRQYKIIINDSEDRRSTDEKEKDAALKKEIKAEICEEIKSAPEISEDEAARIDNGRAETPEAEAALHRYKLTEINGGKSDIDFIVDEFSDRKPEIIGAKIENFERMEPEATLRNQLEDKQDTGFLPDRRKHFAKSELCREIDRQLAGLFDEKRKLETEVKISEKIKYFIDEKKNISEREKNIFYSEYFLPAEIKKIEHKKNKFYDRLENKQHDYTREELEARKIKHETRHKKSLENLHRQSGPMQKKSEKYRAELLAKLNSDLERWQKREESGYIGGIIADEKREGLFNFITENSDRIKTLLKINTNHVLQSTDETRNAEIGIFIRSFYGLFGLKTRRIDRAGNLQIDLKRMAVIRKIIENRKSLGAVTHNLYNKKQNSMCDSTSTFFAAAGA